VAHATRVSGSLLFGALTHEFGAAALHNSAVLVNADGAISGIYDKLRLLAFGEYIPFADRFPIWAKSLAARLPDSPEITPGASPGILRSGELRIGPLICYEDILPERGGARDPQTCW